MIEAFYRFCRKSRRLLGDLGTWFTWWQRRSRRFIGDLWSWSNWKLDQFWHGIRESTRRAGRTIVGWWQLRRFHLLLQSIPALIAALAVVIVMVAVSLAHESEVASAYIKQASRSMAAGNFEGAWVCYQRLAQMERNEPINVYGLSLCLEKLGQKDRAAAVMAQLAPADRLGYGPAHLWMAKNLASTQGIKVQSFDAHLRFAWLAEPWNPEINGLLGRLYLDLNRPGEAEKYLARAAQSSQEHRLLLARSYELQGKRELMKLETQRIIDQAKLDVMAAPEVPSHRLIWADALVLRQEFAAGEALLADGLLRPFGQKYRRPLALLYVAWYFHLPRNEKNSTPGDQLGVLQRGLATDPDCPEVIMALHLAMRADKDNADKIRQTLRAELAAGKAAGAINFVLGADAWERNDLKAAKTHFEVAYHMEPSLAIAANNLAWLLAFGDDPDLPRAMATIQSLVDRWPDDPRFRGTRGHILAKSGNPKGALVDLLKALPVSGHMPELHDCMADVYGQLGLESSAAIHRNLAREKRSKKS